MLIHGNTVCAVPIGTFVNMERTVNLHPGLILTTYCVRYQQVVPFLRNKMAYFLLKTSKNTCLLEEWNVLIALNWEKWVYLTFLLFFGYVGDMLLFSRISSGTFFENQPDSMVVGPGLFTKLLWVCNAVLYLLSRSYNINGGKSKPPYFHWKTGNEFKCGWL